MAAKGYCTAQQVADFLGVTFSAGQQTHCNTLIERAEVAIDNYCHRAWLVGAQTDETYYHPSANLFLRYPPVTTVTAVKATTSLGETEETLTADDDYEVRDLDNGWIRLECPERYYRIRVDYTPDSTVPKVIERACIELVATWMWPHLHPETHGVESFRLPDLEVRYSRQASAESIPMSVQALLDQYAFTRR